MHKFDRLFFSYIFHLFSLAKLKSITECGLPLSFARAAATFAHPVDGNADVARINITPTNQ